MSSTKIASVVLLSVVANAQVTRGHDVPLKNWPAPLYWQPPAAESETGGLRAEVRTPTPQAATPVGSLVFVAMPPCRVVDTRASQMFPTPFGQPSLTSGIQRDFPLQSSTRCSIPVIAQAYSVIVTVVPPGPLGYLTMWPTGQTQPNVVTLDDLPGDIRQTGAIIPAGTPNGSVSAITNGTTDLVIDINGYYAPSTGITLAQGTVNAPSLSFASDATTGIFSSGTGSLSLTTGGTAALTVDSTGDVEVAGSIRKGGTLFLHNRGFQNTALGINALPNTTSGNNNTAIGVVALTSNTTGVSNTAIGAGALQANIGGTANTASGFQSLNALTTGFYNTAAGFRALADTTTGGSNTASGFGALANNITGNTNTASGFSALANSTGNNNIALGYQAGSKLSSGDNNLYLGSPGVTTESNTIRIGTNAGDINPAHTAFFAAGIANATVSGSAVLIDTTTGQLGIASSSRRYKQDIQDMADASRGLLRLRPVTFRYQKPYPDGTQPLDYGLIAEEVAEVYPDLVVKNADGQIETVQYHKLTPMLLNELQKDHQTVQSLQAQVSALQKALEALLNP